MGVTAMGPPVLGAGRIAASGHITGPELDPGGDTSIGAGVVSGKAALDAGQAAASPPFDVLSMLVLTDGEENTAPMLADVGSSITANTFAVGLGQPENISTAALNTLTQNHNGYLLVTGTLTPDQAARLNKYFLQVLAGVTNANVVLDPHGVLTAGAVHKIPFQVAETEYGLDVFALTQFPWALDFELETPDGTLINPASTSSLMNVQYVQTAGLAYYRLSLPGIPTDATGGHAGVMECSPASGRQAGWQSNELCCGCRGGLAQLRPSGPLLFQSLLHGTCLAKQLHPRGGSQRVCESAGILSSRRKACVVLGRGHTARREHLYAHHARGRPRPIRWDAVVALAGIAFGVFVREDRAHGLQHRFRDQIFRRDQLQARGLTPRLVSKKVGDVRVDRIERALHSAICFCVHWFS